MTDTQIQLAWLDKQRSIVNDMIVNLPPDEQKKLMPELQIINAIAERVGKLTAEEFFETVTEECARHEGVCTADSHPCRGCAFDHKCPYATEDWRGAINVVKRWKEEQDGQSCTGKNS